VHFRELPLPGAWLITPELFTDERGVFRRHFCAAELSAHGVAPSVAQGNVSENPHRHTLRGFHYQLAPHAEAKTLSCFSGAIYDVIVDLRPESTTFLEWTAIELTSRSRESLHVPAGCANAYLTLEPDTVVHYYMSEHYEPGSYRGFHYADPSFSFDWPAAPRVISEKDKSLPNLDRQALRR
jgi:dTDP-4-dehydrorhamnose 3,5-epimerase